MPTELELIALKTEFDLYLGFVKRLVLELPNSDDRTRAALWLQKLRTINHPDQMKLRNEHLKLFLFALHRRALVGVFEKKPPKDELESFHDGLTLLEMTRELIEIAEKKKTEAKKEGEEGFGVSPLPPVQTHISFDLKEYASYQEIPKFGSHVYYAVSSEPIQRWRKPDNNNYPDVKAAPNQWAWEIAMSETTDHVLEREAELDAALAAQKEKETGFVFDDGPEEVKEEEEKPVIEPCSGAGGIGRAHTTRKFKWNEDSLLGIHQSFDFTDISQADDLEDQGKQQLELDEEVMAIFDNSLPGRRRANVRLPFFEGLPPDLSERVHHGIVDEVPPFEPFEGQPCEDDDDSDDESDDLDLPPINETHDTTCVCTNNLDDEKQVSSTFEQTDQSSAYKNAARYESSAPQDNYLPSNASNIPISNVDSNLGHTNSNLQPRTGSYVQKTSFNVPTTSSNLQPQTGYYVPRTSFNVPTTSSNLQQQNNSGNFNPLISGYHQQQQFNNSGVRPPCNPQNSFNTTYNPSTPQSYQQSFNMSFPPQQNGTNNLNQWLTQNQMRYQQSFTNQTQPSSYNAMFERDRPTQPDLTNATLANPNLSFNNYSNFNNNNNPNPFNASGYNNTNDGYNNNSRYINAREKPLCPTQNVQITNGEQGGTIQQGY